MRKKAWLRAITHLLASLECVDTGGREYKGPSDAAQLAHEDLIARIHDSLEHNSLGHTWWPGWRPLPETSIEKLPPEPRRQHRREHGLGVFQNNCESLRALDRLYELMALTKRKRSNRCMSTMGSVSGPITGTISFHLAAVDRNKKTDASDQHQVCLHSDQVCASLDAWSDSWPGEGARLQAHID